MLVDDVCLRRAGARTIREEAPKGSKGSNGIVERAVQSVETMPTNEQGLVGRADGCQDQREAPRVGLVE